MVYGFKGLGFRVYGLGLRFRVEGLGFRAKGLGKRSSRWFEAQGPTGATV